MRSPSPLRRFILLVALTLSCLSIACRGTSTPVEPGPQPGRDPDAFASNPLPTDPRLVVGRLDNGFEYIVQPHQRPPGRVALYLHIDSGALNETTSQNGLAHFLEHMAFNGSRNYPPGELLKEIERLGILFGPHSNAHTGQFETVYKLFMPNNRPETIDTGLTMFADFAYGLSLLDSEVEKERAVIQNEKTSREGLRMRIGERFIDAVFGGTRFAEHDVIGTDEVIRTAPRRELKDYYDAWYQPENMTLIVVGEVDPADIADKAERFFGSDVFQPRAPSRPSRNSGIKPIEETRAFVIADAEQPRAEIQVLALRPGREPMRTEAEYRFNEIENLGPWILNQRLATLQEQGTVTFDSAQAGVGSIQTDIILPSAQAAGSAEQWRTSFEELLREIKRMIDHGVGESELTRAKEAILAATERAAEREQDLDAERVIDSLNGLVASGAPRMSAAQHLEQLRKALATVTVKDVRVVFSQNFRPDGYTYVIILPERGDLTIPEPPEVLAIAQRVWQAPTQPFEETQTVDAILPELPAPGEVTGRSFDETLGVTTVTLTNRAIVRHREMDYEDNLVRVRLTLPGGPIEESEGTRGLSMAANLVNSTSHMTSTQLRNYMIGKQVQINAGFAEDAYHVVIESSREDLEAGLQCAFGFLTDGKIEASQFESWQDDVRAQIATRDSQPAAQLEHALHSTLLGGDSRFAPLDESDLDRITPPAAEAWLGRLVSLSPIEAAIVGDITLDDALPLLARYVGGMPIPSEGFDRLDPLRKIERGPGPFEMRREFEGVTPQALALIGYVGTDRNEIHDRRCLTVASFILTERMTRTIREELGLVYSINCLNQPAGAIPGTGFVGVQVPTQPESVEPLVEAVTSLMSDFAATGATEEELTTTQLQIANLQKAQFQRPTFWLGQLSELTYRGRTLDDLQGIEEYYQSLKTSDIQQAAEKYFQPARAVRLIAVPGRHRSP